MTPIVPAPTEVREGPQEPHAMSLEFTFPSGAQQWRCPVCARQTVIQYPSARQRFKMIVLAAGDEAVTHNTGSDGLRISSAAVAESTDPTDAFASVKADGLLH
jgi:hypothetical protein